MNYIHFGPVSFYIMPIEEMLSKNSARAVFQKIARNPFDSIG